MVSFQQDPVDTGKQDFRWRQVSKGEWAGLPGRDGRTVPDVLISNAVKLPCCVGIGQAAYPGQLMDV